MDKVSEVMQSEIFMIALTVIVYWGATQLQRRTGWLLLNPLLVSIAVIITILKLTGMSYDEYATAGHMIEFWLKPAIVALGYPLYNELRHIRRQLVMLLVTETVGCVAGILSVALIARWLGASDEVILSLAPKSVSAPIAIEISSEIGGIPALTSAIVVTVGLLGAVIGLRVMDWGNVRRPVSQSLSMGTAAHVIGTTRISRYGERYGAYATLGLILNGILTSFFAAPIMRLVL